MSSLSHDGRSVSGGPTEEMVERAAKALFAKGYAPDPRRVEVVDEHWPHVSQGVRDAYLAEARRVVTAALGGPYA